MRRVVCTTAILALVLVLVTLAACGTQPETPAATLPASYVVVVLGTPGINDQATQAAVLTLVQDNADNQAVATAEIVRAYAQATLNSANATLSAAQLQDQNNANAIAAQIAATAEIVRAQAQATLVAASWTQSAAQTQDAYQQTLVQEQQNRNEIAAATQTAVANLVATQTQAANATAQWYADQTRQREEQRLVPIAFLWTWCLPVFVVLLAGLVLWGFWRWLKTQQANQRIIEQPIEKLQAPVNPVNLQDRFLPPGSDIIDGSYAPTKPDEQIHGWMDEIKGKLLDDEKDENDNPDS